MESLVDAGTLTQLLQSPTAPQILDVRWELSGGPRYDLYLRGHIPGGVFIDLDRDLAGPPGSGGRHPLPDGAEFQAAMRAAGIDSGHPVVVYDAGPATAAARAWWLLRYFGHPAVAVLDGGLVAWERAGGTLEPGEVIPTPGDFTVRPGGMPTLDAAGAAAVAERGILLDARSAERFRGEHEPLDPVAGHIPGARNRATTDNLSADGQFLPGEQLRAAFSGLGITQATPVGSYCGSGVTAAHQVLALTLAGYRASLYPGSWSEWIADPGRPVARGAG